MSVIANKHIQQKLTDHKFFDLVKNNQRLGVVIQTELDPTTKLRAIFDRIVGCDRVDDGYYEIQNLFTLAQACSPDTVLNLIIEAVALKLKSIDSSISLDDGSMDKVTLGMYIQLWKSYRSFCDTTSTLVRTYARYLTDSDIKVGTFHQNALSIVTMCMFHDSIINRPGDLLQSISNDLSDVDRKNVEQLIEYVDSIRAFMAMSDFTTIKRDALVVIIKSIVDKTHVINAISLYLHQLMRSLINPHKVLPDECETIAVTDFEKQTLRKIYKVTAILQTYSDRTKLLYCHKKFMQARIVDYRYPNLELEIEVIKRLSGRLGKDESQKLIDAVADIMNSRKIASIIQNSSIKVTSEKYKSLTDIAVTKVSPFILSKRAWSIFNTSELKPTYPLEMQCYLDIISKCYGAMHKNEFVINWQPTMGSARFTAQLGRKQVDITCTLLQAVAIMTFNDKPEMTVKQFADTAFINLTLAEKIITSLCEGSVLIKSSNNAEGDVVYCVNTVKYLGEAQIDVRRFFAQTFEEEVKIEPKTEDPIESSSADADTDALMPESKSRFIAKEVARLRNTTHSGASNKERLCLAHATWNAMNTAKRAEAVGTKPVTVSKSVPKQMYSDDEDSCSEDCGCPHANYSGSCGGTSESESEVRPVSVMSAKAYSSEDDDSYEMCPKRSFTGAPDESSDDSMPAPMACSPCPVRKVSVSRYPKKVVDDISTSDEDSMSTSPRPIRKGPARGHR